MPPHVSVVLPTYERSSLLPRAIESVLQQTYDDLECIVVNDGSTDATEEVVQDYDESQIKYVCHDSNRGLSAARNTGIDHASGEFIAFLDDDDEWLPSKVEKQIGLISGLPDSYGVVYCWSDYYRDDDLVQQYRPSSRGYVLPEVLDRQRLGAGTTLLVRAEVFDYVGTFDTALSRGIDGDFLRRVARDYLVDYVPEVLVHQYVDHGHERITRRDEDGIRNAIHGHRIKLSKFGAELERYPSRAGIINARIGYHHGVLGEWGPSSRYFGRAFATAPFTSEVYRTMIRAAKDAVSDRLNEIRRGDR